MTFPLLPKFAPTGREVSKGLFNVVEVLIYSIVVSPARVVISSASTLYTTLFSCRDMVRTRAKAVSRDGYYPSQNNM